MKIYADHAATTAVSTSVLTRSPARVSCLIVFSIPPAPFGISSCHCTADVIL